jgi:integration host factor subunit beta
MTDALAQGKRVEIRGFGSFSIRHRRPRNARNPKTGETVPLSAKIVTHFKPGKEMRDQVNASHGQSNFIALNDYDKSTNCIGN